MEIKDIIIKEIELLSNIEDVTTKLFNAYNNICYKDEYLSIGLVSKVNYQMVLDVYNELHPVIEEPIVTEPETPIE